jgi:hypothetical protein
MITGKVTQDVWFDNWMAKPPLIDKSSPYSILVFFEAKPINPNVSGYFCGQFNYEKREWDVIPTGPVGPFFDEYVTKWMHIPDGAAYDKKGTNNV